VPGVVGNMKLKDKISNLIFSNDVIFFLFSTTLAVARRFAWLLNPIFSLWRFRKVRRIGNRIADWCFDSEKNIEIFVTKPIPHLDWASFELLHPNSNYGYTKALKNYVGLPDIYPLKASLYHGVLLPDDIADSKLMGVFHDINVPVHLAWSRHEETMLCKYHCDNKVYVIGSPFLYADSFFSDEYIERERNRLGRNLLVFPSHGIETTVLCYEENEFIMQLAKYKSMFDSIRICMFWRDIQTGKHQYYVENGFECVSAGHVLDCNFVSRLKGLLKICDAAITNQVGAYIGFCIAMDKPIAMTDLVPMDVTGNKQSATLRTAFSKSTHRQRLANLLKKNEEFKITEEIREAVEPCWGLREMKTKEELRQIFYEAEQLFKMSPNRYSFLEYR
jgi:hypothetical protein